MTEYRECKILPHYPDQIYDLVIDINKYPKFLPWCMAARITKRDGSKHEGVLRADLLIGFQMFRESYTSRVSYARPHLVSVEFVEGPFKFLTNEWRFQQVGPRQTQVDFHVAFEFNSEKLQQAMGGVFGDAVSRMMNAFETRADMLFGDLDA